MKKIIILDYGCGNIVSLQRAIKKVGFESLLSNKPEEIFTATHLILPGVGAFGNAMKLLNKFKLVNVIKEYASRNKPLLGICLGMQLFLTKSYEFGEHRGLNLIEGNVEKLSSQTKNKLKIPHIGWNDISFKNSISKFKNFEKKNFYFVHSYIGKTTDPNNTIAFSKISDVKIPAVIKHKNILGFQFHPEKSRDNGLDLIKLFCNEN